MRRTEQEIREHNQLLATRHHPDVNLQLTTDTVGKLSLKAPPPPKTWQDLSHILQCSIAFARMFFPKAQMTPVLDHVYTDLIEQGAYLIQNSNIWCTYKPREIIYELLQLEQAEFQHCVPLDDLVDQTTSQHSIPWFQYHRLQQLYSNCLQATPATIAALMPTELRPLPPPRSPSDARDLSSEWGGHQDQRPPPRTRNDQRQGHQQQSLTPPVRRSPQFHDHLQQLWNTAPPARAAIGLTNLLRNGDSDINQCFQCLSLTQNDCGQYHIKGECSRPHCNHLHEPNQLQTVAVDTVIGHLQQGIASG